MNDTSSNPNAEGGKTPAERHVFGWLLFPLALFPLVALMTYDWRAIAALRTPPEPSTNWIGPLGDGFAFYGYQLFGLAIWIVPVMCLIGGLCLVAGRKMRPGRRGAWFTLVLVCAACLMQVAQSHAPGIAAFLAKINLANSGGALGYLIMERFLSRCLSDFGASVIVIIVLLVSLVAAIGVHNLISFFVAIYRWVTVGKYLDSVRQERKAGAARATGDFGEAATDPEQDMYLAALAAKDEAKRQREADKARARAEKEAAREQARAD
ncbi:MAG: DNA translocase FtsK 4TM domain-containing protein, partial [Kiritimatiellae bacterium]|nr:DNA translocase FtsK 4TM domain-containing protein [Kiritimatiellia bacterium]